MTTPKKKTSPRSKARRFALQMIYQLHTPNNEVAELQPHFLQFWQDAGEIVPDEVKQFSEELVEGVEKNLEEIDGRIEKHATHWRLDRMALIDLSILRLGAFELIFGTAPREVALNEAIELTKQFSVAEATKFVNGILDSLAEGKA